MSEKCPKSGTQSWAHPNHQSRVAFLLCTDNQHARNLAGKSEEMVLHRFFLNFEGAWPPSAQHEDEESEKMGRKGEVDIQPDAFCYIINFPKCTHSHMTMGK